MVSTSHKNIFKWSSLLMLLFAFFADYVLANKEDYYGKFIGKLSQLHHGVSGDVFAVDARTLHLRNFNYDGEGPAAYFYVGNGKVPGVNGFRLRDERGTTNVLPKYRNKHITITLPEGKSLQNINWFSVWCDEFSVNFGDVKISRSLDFPKPQKISGLNGVHGVSSEPIVIVDAQTLLIPNFSYDGEAPDAKFWVGPGLKPTPQGIRIPDENGKEVPLRRYDRKTIVLTLPGDLTIFDIGHFGVWCEAFTVDFGHVQIPKGLNIPPSLKMLGVSPQKRSSYVADPLSFQKESNYHFGRRQTVHPQTDSLLFYRSNNTLSNVFQDIKPTTYKPSNLANLPPLPNYNNNNAFEIQKSISLGLNDEYVINEQTGDFVTKGFDFERNSQSHLRPEKTPAEKILFHNPARPSNNNINGIAFTQEPLGDFRHQLPPRGNFPRHPLGPSDVQSSPLLQYLVQPGSLLEQVSNVHNGRSGNQYDQSFKRRDQIIPITPYNYFPSDNRFAFNRFTGPGGYVQNY